jgi:anaerobic selenocysteine-containing dehydrogenase
MVRLAHALTELEPPVHALVVYNSNPATTAPDSTRVLRGLAREDLFTVVLEHFLTDTARYADVVLPATTQVEHVDLVPSWGHTYITYNEPAIAPVGEALPNTEIFRRLARAMGFEGAAFDETDEELARAAVTGARAPLHTVDFERLRAVGWAEADLPEDFRPFAQGGFGTPSGRLRLWSRDLPPGYDPPPGDPEPLALMTAKSAHHFLNSTYANLPRHLAAEGEPRLDLHADDAAARGIADGDVVRVRNARGEVIARARIGDIVGPGVVALPSGWWASRSPGATMANALTTEELTDRGGGGAFHSARVEVEPVLAPVAAGPAPASHPAEVP